MDHRLTLRSKTIQLYKENRNIFDLGLSKISDITKKQDNILDHSSPLLRNAFMNLKVNFTFSRLKGIVYHHLKTKVKTMRNSPAIATLHSQVAVNVTLESISLHVAK